MRDVGVSKSETTTSTRCGAADSNRLLGRDTRSRSIGDDADLTGGSRSITNFTGCMDGTDP